MSSEQPKTIIVMCVPLDYLMRYTQQSNHYQGFS